MDKLAYRFGLVYGLLAFVALVSLVGFYKGLTYKSYHLPKSVASKIDVARAVKAAIGDQNLVAQCEASITGSVNSNYGQVTKPYKVVSVKPNKDGIHEDVVVVLTSDIYTGKLDCTFHKTNWSLQGVKAVK